MEGTNCGLMCQHPGCWNSSKIDIINAYKRLGLPPLLDADLSQNVTSRTEFLSEVTTSAKLVENGLSHRLSTSSLPTLKVVNLLESDVDSEDNYSTDNPAGYYVPFLPRNREASHPLSSDASREFSKASRNPKAPCVSPSPSFSSLYLKKLRQRSKKKLRQNDSCHDDNSKPKPATYIQFQDANNDSEESLVPYLVWVPSKKKKKRRKCKSADSESVSQAPKVSMKHITGCDSDFGYLTTPYNQENVLRSHSRATHTVRSSPNRLYPRRLPPVSRDEPEKKRSGIHLLGDGLLMDGKDFPKTPKNTPASIKPLLSKIEKDVTENQNKEALAKDPEKPIESQDKSFISDEIDGTLVIQNGKHLPALDHQNDLNASDMPFHKREELQLPRVTLPKDKLRHLPIENHCRNSIPSHQLQGIQMQPVEGTGATPSRASTASLLGRIISEEVKNLKESLIVEASLSDKDYIRLLGSEALEGREVQDIRERLLFRWEVSEDIPRPPAPTPATPMKKGTFEPRTQNIDSINECVPLKEELSQHEIEEYSNSIMTELKPKYESIDNEMNKRDGSPIPSKASITDWPTDKDIMKQTYEKYRSFTPFKSPGVSLLEARLDMIKEVNENIRKKTFNALLIRQDRVFPYPLYNTLGLMQRDVMHPRPRPIVTRSLKHSAFLQKRMNTSNISEISVSTMNPNERKSVEKYNRSITNKGPLRVDKMSLMDPSTKPKHDHVPSYEIYEAKLKQDNLNLDSAINRVSDSNRDLDQLHVVIPVPNSTPCELAETISDEDIAVNNSNGTLMIIDDNSVLEKIKEIDTNREKDNEESINRLQEDCSEISDGVDLDAADAIRDSGSSPCEVSIDEKQTSEAEMNFDSTENNTDMKNIENQNNSEDESKLDKDESKLDKDKGKLDKDESKVDNSENLQTASKLEQKSPDLLTTESNIEIKVDDENTTEIQDAALGDDADGDDLDAIIEKSSFNDFELDSIPDLTTGLDMSLNLSEQVKRAMMDVSDIESENDNDL